MPAATTASVPEIKHNTDLPEPVGVADNAPSGAPASGPPERCGGETMTEWVSYP